MNTLKIGRITKSSLPALILATGLAAGPVHAQEWDHLLQVYVPDGAARQATLTTPRDAHAPDPGARPTETVWDPQLQAWVGRSQDAARDPVSSNRHSEDDPQPPAAVVGQVWDPLLQTYVGRVATP
ncbi:hypothetical protein [Ectothiorhodospira mobilis]|uniref:Uncharacterized protein n=1 Tax=Ectothiorhodospira mobilis TaxID=195064 RepID=A0A1I4SW55_ECTMO|nr:hypothetical protein [Ectothiorhodospira mobilis]MCG5535002.1 hypothetical protein [Ectothiorhodospira mobilis]SFM68661.1 hypothetical protein SAMN05421721_12319 [Ectothiorhodospira mobilis]